MRLSKIRLIRSPRASATKNCSIDAKLLQTFSTSSTPILRIYSWEPSYTVGISQTNINRPTIDNLESAKRITGGGLLLHGHDISYTFILPALMLKKVSVKKSYEIINTFLLKFYAMLGLNSSYAKDLDSFKHNHTSLCHTGCEPYDLLILGKKIGGNAQKRTKIAILQHGSVPLFTKKKYKNYHGATLEDFGINLTIQEAQELLIKAFFMVFLPAKAQKEYHI